MRKFLLLFAAIACVAFVGCSKDDGGNDKSMSCSINIDNGGIIYNNEPASISVNITGDAAEVVSVDFYIDGDLAKSVFASPFTYNATLKDLSTGTHTINAVVKCTDNSTCQSEGNFTFKVKAGDEYQGGIIISTKDELSGIIAAKNDLTGGTLGRYKYGSYRDYGAYSMDNGLANTDKFNGTAAGDYAAFACLEFELNGYNDWYLPAFNEIALFEDYLQELNIPERSGYKYWTSTESSDNDTKAYAYGFGVSIGNPFDKQELLRVRPVRRF